MSKKQNKKPKYIKYERYRVHHPFHNLLSTAHAGITLAKEGKQSVPQNTLVAILFSALAVEGLVNSFGEVFIDNWNDYESSTIIVKLRTLMTVIEMDNLLSDDDWVNLRGLIKFRNKIAHPRKEKIILSGTTDLENYERNIKHTSPISKWDKSVTTQNAQIYVDLAHCIHKRLSEHLLQTKLNYKNHNKYERYLAFLVADGWHGEGEIQSILSDNNVI